MEIKYIVKNNKQQPVVTMGYSLLNMAAGNGIIINPVPNSLVAISNVDNNNRQRLAEGPYPHQEEPKVIHVNQFRRGKMKGYSSLSDFDMDGDDTLMSLRERMRLLTESLQDTATSKEIPLNHLTH